MSNKLFGTDGVRGIAGKYPLSADFAYNLACVLSKKVCLNKKKVVIGKDTRNSGDMLESALSTGFLNNGVDVLSLGVVPTPLITSMIGSLDADMALMITASHNPYYDNGIKLIDRDGYKFPDDFYTEIEALIEQKQVFSETTSFGRLFRNKEIVEDYIAKARDIAPNYKALQGLRVVIDCANGAYSYILPQTFKDLGAGVITINNQPDGFNINKNCGSQHTEHLSQTVIGAHAHFGIATDGDGDRIILVDDKGQIVDGDQLLCFLAQYLKKHNLLESNGVISTEWSNLGLGAYLQQHGFSHYQSKVGERYVIDLMKEKSVCLGGESVGHIVLSRYAKSGDALVTSIILALAYLEEQKQLSEIFPIFQPYPCLIENIRFSSKEAMSDSVEHEDVKQALAMAKQDLGSQSTVIARKSGTEPVIKLRIEGKDADLVQKNMQKLRDLISSYQK